MREQLELFDYFTPCVVCGHPAAHRHHPAPRAAFGFMADLYGTQALCREHHQLWHNTMAAHGYRARSGC